MKKLKYDVNREAANISALLSGKVDEYEYLTGKEVIPSNKSQMKEQLQSRYSPLEKAVLKKWIKYLKTFKSFQ